MPRLFTALEVPADVAAMLSSLSGGLDGARWIEPEDYHITLRFIGDVDDRTAHELADALADIERPGFTLRVDRLDAFGGRKPRAIFAAIAPNAGLSQLQREHERIARRAGLPPETRKFTPHITLARLKGVKPERVAHYLSRTGGLAPRMFDVDRFALFSSRQSVGGGPYIVEESYRLFAERLSHAG